MTVYDLIWFQRMLTILNDLDFTGFEISILLKKKKKMNVQKKNKT